MSLACASNYYQRSLEEAQRLTPLGGGYARNALQIIRDLHLIPSAEQALDAVRDGSAHLDD